MSKANFLDVFLIERIGIALARWKSVWDAHRKRLSSGQFMRLGFVKYALEFWLLSKCIWQKVQKDQGGSNARDDNSSPHDRPRQNSREIKEVIKSLGTSLG